MILTMPTEVRQTVNVTHCDLLLIYFRVQLLERAVTVKVKKSLYNKCKAVSFFEFST